MTTRPICVAAVALALVTLAHAQELPRWELSAQPMLHVGVALADDSPTQFFGLNSATRMPDGSILLVNSGSRELRKFSATGEFIARAGRKGSGPLEFEWPVRIYPQRGGTYAVYDAQLERLSHYDADLSYLRTEPATGVEGSRFRRDNWLVGRYWVDGLAAPYPRAVVNAALRKLGAPRDPLGFRRVLVSRDGMLWVRDVAADGTPDSEWRVHDNNGSLLGVVALPDRFEPLEIGTDYVLGRRFDADDVEYLAMYALLKGGSPVTVPQVPRAGEPGVSETERRATFGFLRNMFGLQEIHYSKNGSYATSVAALDVQPPPDLHILIAAADSRGWLALAIPKDRGIICTYAVGAHAPVGWTPGVVVCAEPL